MNLKNECLPCIMKQAYNTAKRASENDDEIREILNKTADYVKTLKSEMTPADASNFAYEITKKITCNDDPYKYEKKKFNDICMKYLPIIEKKIDETDDSLYYSVILSIFGNIIDLGIGMKFDFEKEINNVFETKLTLDDYDNFKKDLKIKNKKILFLGDNAGEMVFDIPLIKKLKENNDVVYVVKSGPIINDSTMEDAKYTGLEKIVKVIETGSDGIGVRWDSVSEEFLKYYKEAEIIISKGQGNFETMNKKKGNIYFLLRIKCDSVGEELGVKFGDIVFKNQRNI